MKCLTTYHVENRKIQYFCCGQNFIKLAFLRTIEIECQIHFEKYSIPQRNVTFNALVAHAFENVMASIHFEKFILTPSRENSFNSNIVEEFRDWNK